MIMPDHPPKPRPEATAKTHDHSTYISFFARAHPLKIEHTTPESYLNELKGRMNSVFDGMFDGAGGGVWWPLKDYERPLKAGEVRFRWNSKCCGTELTWIVQERCVKLYEAWLRDVNEPTSPAFVGARDGGAGKSGEGEGNAK